LLLFGHQQQVVVVVQLMLEAAPAHTVRIKTALLQLHQGIKILQRCFTI